jgi:hypothetical protein
MMVWNWDAGKLRGWEGGKLKAESSKLKAKEVGGEF